MTTYYVSPSGLNTNSGLTPSVPLLHAPGMPAATGNAVFTPVAGDIIYLMDGVWSTTGNGWDLSGTGTESAPIQFRVYPGDEAIIDNRFPANTLTWTNIGGNVWTAPHVSSGLQAAWLGGLSLLVKTASAGLLEGQIALVANVLYVNVPGNPAWYEFYVVTTGTKGYAARMRTDFIHLNGEGGSLIMRGGSSSILSIQMPNDTKDLVGNKILNLRCDYHRSGITLDGTQGVTKAIKQTEISGCTVDSKLDSGACSAVSNTGINGNGMTLQSAIDGAIIRGNTVRNFGHDGISITTAYTGKYGAKNITVDRNDVSCPALNYGRPLGVAGDAYNIDVFGNYLHDATTSNQFGCVGGRFIGNVIERITGTPLYPGQYDQGLLCQSWDTGSGKSYLTALEIRNNTIKDVAGEGISLSTSNNVLSVSCSIANNITKNCGSYDLEVREYAGVIVSFSSKNNCFSGNRIYDRTVEKTVAAAAGAEHVGNIAIDPMLTSSYKTAGALQSAGTPAPSFLTKMRDFYGKGFGAVPSIGAVQHQAARTVDLTRTEDSTRRAVAG